MIAARPRRLPRSVRSAAWLLGLYLATALAFAFATGTTGLLSPSGAPNAGVIALGAVFLVLRLAAYFVVPALLAHAGLGALFSRASRVSRPSRPSRAMAASAGGRAPGDGAVGRSRFRRSGATGADPDT